MAHSNLQQRTLKHYFAGDKPEESKETGDSSEVNNNVVPEQTEKNKCKIARKFQMQWLRLYPWLNFDGNVMTCTLCIERGRKNVFTTGNCNFRTSTLDDHQKTGDHQMALKAASLQTEMTSCQKKANSEEEKAIIDALKSTFWLAKEGLPLVKFKSLINLLRAVNAPDIKHLKVSDEMAYDSSYSALEFLHSISNVLKEELFEKLQSSPFVTVLADESTDITVNKRLVIYAQILNPTSFETSTEFVANVKLSDGTGEGIANAIYRELQSCGVPPEKIMGLGSDGASVMTGRGKGVTGMMLRKNPHLLNVHCIAHRLALCTSQAAESVPAMKDYQEVITSIYYYFKYSPCKQDQMANIQEILDSPQLKYKEVHSVRWLSFYGALETVYRTLDALLTYLAQAAIAHKDAKALGLKKKIMTKKFLALTYILMDIIPHVTKLSLFFQKDDLDIALVKVNIAECLRSLGELKEKPGNFESEFGQHISLLDVENETKTVYKGEHEIASCQDLHVSAAKRKFLEKLISNLNERFPSSDVLSALGSLSMRPISFLSRDDLDTWGNDDIEILTNHFACPKSHSWTEGSGHEKQHHTKVSEPLIDAKDTLTEWKALKPRVIALKFPRDNTRNLWCLINQFCQDEYPNLLKLAALGLTCPIHTSGCERGFSIQNSILTSSRNRLNPETQEDLIRVKGYKMSIDDFPFEKALQQWKADKKRRIFSKCQ